MAAISSLPGIKKEIAVIWTTIWPERDKRARGQAIRVLKRDNNLDAKFVF